jgi:hypothetical protein
VLHTHIGCLSFFLRYIFETSLLGTLTEKFFEVPMFRNDTLQCLTEIAGLTEGVEQYVERVRGRG